MGPGLVDPAQVERRHQDLLLVGAGFGEELAGRPGDKALAPKLDAVAGQFFVADPVRDGDVASVGNGVAALDGFPGGVLQGSRRGLLRRMPPDGGRIKENLGALKRRQSRGFRIPLVPADQDPDAGVAGAPGPEAEVARGEIELLVIERVVRDVHFPVQAQQRAVGVDHRRGIVVQAFGAFLEERGDNHNATTPGEFLERLGARTVSEDAYPG